MIAEHVPLAPRTTFKIGGSARYFVNAHTEEDIDEAVSYARAEGLPLWVMGAGSNLLVPDAGVDGVVLKIEMHDISIEAAGTMLLLSADAGALWEQVVDTATAHGAFGIENLAGIPGTVAGAAVQNIGAYGAELADVFAYADGIESSTGVRRRIDRAEAMFAYRSSYFKEHRDFVITRVAMRLQRQAVPDLSYPDLVRARAEGVPLATPADIACAVRAIRAKKFPARQDEGTAGSFFKNPVVSRETFDTLCRRYPDLQGFLQENGDMKVSLAWVLDHILGLKGYAHGAARLYEAQPLVIVACEGASAADVDALAREVAEKVSVATGISIEREVELFGVRK